MNVIILCNRHRMLKICGMHTFAEMWIPVVAHIFSSIAKKQIHKSNMYVCAQKFYGIIHHTLIFQ